MKSTKITSEITSEVKYCNKLPKLHRTQSLLLVDRYLGRSNSILRAWLKLYPHVVYLPAGEKLKDSSAFFKRFEPIQKILHQNSEISQIVVIGGGSLGDACAFFASIFRRGFPLIQVPSTWLSALDSAHGGKTALNTQFKNSYGSYYPAKQIYICKELLFNQPEKLWSDALGEILKMGLINRPEILESLKTHQVGKSSVLRESLKWKLVRHCIEGKWQVVDQDPYEQKGLRQHLNLGHTLGHILEAHSLKPYSKNSGIRGHGEAVALGTLFSLWYSRQKKLITQKLYQELTELYSDCGYKLKKSISSTQRVLLKFGDEEFQKVLKSDKKSKANHLSFVFFQKPGKTLLRKVSIRELAKTIRIFSELKETDLSKN